MKQHFVMLFIEAMIKIKDVNGVYDGKQNRWPTIQWFNTI